MLVLQLIADASGEPSPFEGYLKKFDPEFDPYDGLIGVTATRSEALRPDGEPNRPLTAFTVRFVQIEA